MVTSEASVHQVLAPLRRYPRSSGRIIPLVYADLSAPQQQELAEIVANVDARIASGDGDCLSVSGLGAVSRWDHADVVVQRVTHVGYEVSLTNAVASDKEHGRQELWAGGGFVWRCRGDQEWQVADPAGRIRELLLEWLRANPVARAQLDARKERDKPARRTLRDALSRWRRPKGRECVHLAAFQSWLPDPAQLAGVPAWRDSAGHVTCWAYRMASQDLDVLAKLVAQHGVNRVTVHGWSPWEDAPAGAEAEPLALFIDDGQWVLVGDLILVLTTGLRVLAFRGVAPDVEGDIAALAGVDADVLGQILRDDVGLSLPDAVERARLLG